MTIPVASPIVKGYVGGTPVVTPDVPIVVVNGTVSLTDGAHWGRLVEVTGGVEVPDTLTTGFWCYVRNTGTSNWTFRALSIPSINHPIEGVIVLKPGQAAYVVKRVRDTYVTLLGTPDFVAAIAVVITSRSTSLTAAQVGRYVLLNGSSFLTITLPPYTSVQEGAYYVVDNSTTATLPSFVTPSPGSRIAGVVNSDPVPPNRSRLYRYAGDGAWTRISNFGESISPVYTRNTVENLSLPSGRAITPALWASTYGNGVLQGGGLNLLPDLGSSLVTVGSSIRLIATDPAGMEISPDTNDTIEILTPNNQTNYVIPHNSEMVVMKRSATSTVWRLLYFGPARQPVGAGSYSRFEIVSGSWLGQDGDVQNDVANHELTRIGFTRGALNLPESIREIFDNTIVTRSAVPNTDTVAIKAKTAGPGIQVADYALTSIPLTPDTYFVLVQRPDELASVSDDGTGGRYSVKRVDSTFEEFNQYRVVVMSIGSGATAVIPRGGAATIHNIVLNDRFIVPEQALSPHSISLNQLKAEVVARLVSAGDLYHLATLAGHIVDVNNAFSRDRNPRINVRYEGFFLEPTADGGAFPTNKAPTTTNIAVQNPSAASTRLGPSTTSDRSQGVLQGPSLFFGGFDVVPTSGVLTLATDLRGILIVVTADHTVGQSTEVLWAIPGTRLALQSRPDNKLQMTLPREGVTPQTQTRREQLILQDIRGRQVGILNNNNLEIEFVLPTAVTTPRVRNDTIQVNTRYYDRASDVHDHWLDIQNFNIPNLAADVSEVSRSLQTSSFPGAAQTLFFSYTASSRRIKLRYAPWTQTQGVIHVRAFTMNNTIVTIGAGTDSFTLDFPIPTNQRSTVATHLWKQNNRVNFRIAVNGRLVPSLTSQLTLVNPTGPAYVNPTIQFGGSARTYQGFLQKILVGEVRQTVASNILSGDALAAISGRYSVPLYGLTTPAAGTHEEIVAQGLRWEKALNGGAALPTVSTIETLNLGAPDDNGMPPVPPLIASDIHEYRYELVVTQTLAGVSSSAVVNWSDLGLAVGSRSFRYRWSPSLINPTGNELVVTENAIRLDLNAISSHPSFTGTPVTATFRLIRA